MPTLTSPVPFMPHIILLIPLAVIVLKTRTDKQIPECSGGIADGFRAVIDVHRHRGGVFGNSMARGHIFRFKMDLYLRVFGNGGGVQTIP